MCIRDRYLRRIRYWRGQGTTIQAHAVRRFGSGYGDVNRKEGFAGASALRKMMMAGDRELAADYVPDNVVSDLWAAEDPRRAEERAFLDVYKRQMYHIPTDTLEESGMRTYRT